MQPWGLGYPSDRNQGIKKYLLSLNNVARRLQVTRGMRRWSMLPDTIFFFSFSSRYMHIIMTVPILPRGIKKIPFSHWDMEFLLNPLKI